MFGYPGGSESQGGNAKTRKCCGKGISILYHEFFPWSVAAEPSMSVPGTNDSGSDRHNKNAC